MTTLLESQPWSTSDGPTLVRAAAALQLLPANRPCYLRLQRLAAIGSALPARGEVPPLSASRLRQVLRNEVVDSLQMREDPPEDLFVTEVPFHGGPHLVIEGLTSQSAHTVKLLLRAIFRPDEPTLPEQYRSDAALLTQSLLRISDLVCRRAGLRRGQAPSTSIDGRITVPGKEELQYLTHAVVLDHSSLAKLLPKGTIPFVQSLAIEAGSPSFDIDDTRDDRLVVTPLMWIPEGILVANPGELSSALRHHLITLAGRHGCQPELAAAFRREVADHSQFTLRLLGSRPTGPVETTDDPLILRQRFTLADDKFIDLAILTDDLSDYPPDDPHGVWEVPQLGHRAQAIVDSVGPAEPEDTQTLRLVLYEPLGRTSAFSITATRRAGPILLVRSEELEVIALLDGIDPLALWRFAQADKRLHEESRVISFCALDRYGIYRTHDYSFYLSDERKPDVVNVSTDYALPLRIEAQRRTDAHEVRSPHRPSYVEVVSMHGADKAPIYFLHPRYVDHDKLVELDAVKVWIGPGSGEPPTLISVFDHVTSAAAYWIWQISRVRPTFLTDASSDGLLYIELTFDDEDAWRAAVSGSPQTGSEQPWIQSSPSSWGHAKLRMNASGARSVLSPDNGADRLLVAALVESLADAAGTPVTSIPMLVDEVAPIGRKKLLRVDTADKVLLRPSNVRHARLVQPAVSAVVLDDLGGWLAENGMRAGPVPNEQRTSVLGDCVSYYFEQIKAAVARLSPDGLLEYLVDQDEAQLHEDAMEQRSLAYRVACFGESPDLAAEIERNERERVEAAIASRFIVEYVAAAPPSGAEKMTLDTYDRLLALSADLYSRATLSDAIHYGFSEATLSYLESDRLGVSRGDRYQAGTSAYAAAQAEATRRAAIDPQPKSVPRAEKPPTAKVEAAMQAEFGFSLTDLAHAIGELIGLADERGAGEPYRLPRAEAENHLTTALDWPAEKARNVIDQLSLRPRAEFLSVGADAYPWRYNREWSYLRRPLIQTSPVEGDSVDLVWGPRRTWSAGSYWTHLVYSGRMRAKSKLLKDLVSTIRQDENVAFEHAVADALAAGGCAIKDARLAKVCGKKLRSPEGDDLGDIDAIGIDPTHRMIFVAEAKDFELARIPREFAHEADNLVHGDKSALRKLSARTLWVKRHLATVLKHFHIEADASGWTVLSIIATSRDLVSPNFLTSDVPVLPIGEVKDFVAAKLLRARTPRRNGPSGKGRRR